MLLFLDVISPIPEFFVIEDNKVIIHRKIVSQESNRLSDNIFETFNLINNEVNLTKKLKKIAMTIGPGSYTSLRVGAAFVSGLLISKNLLFYPFSIQDLFQSSLNKFNNNKLCFFISSSNNQNFLCILNNKKIVEYIKLDDLKINLPKEINTILYNNHKLEFKFKDLKQIKFSFIEHVLNHNKEFKFVRNVIVNPIYISNSKILN